MKRYTLFLLAALVTPVGACDRGEPGEVVPVEDVGSVRVSRATIAPTGAPVAGRVVASRTAEIATRTSGTIERMEVDVGSRVTAGQVMARLEASGVESSVARAEAQAMLARRTYERISNLERDGAATRQELDQSEAGVRSAEAALEEARAARGYVTLRAPFAGTVVERYADPGDLAVPGRPVLVVSGSGGVKIEADVPATLAGNVAVGEPVLVVRPETGRSWSATVSRVVPVIDPATHRFRMEVVFDAVEDLPLAGSYVRLELAGTGASSAWVPRDALVRRGQLTGVFVALDGELRLRWIRTGRGTPDALEVLAGLGDGALVVRRPDPALSDGATVGAIDTVEWSPAPEGAR